MSKFKVGDKVRVLNVEAISCGHEVWRNGDITEVVGFSYGDEDHPRLKATKPNANCDACYIEPSEYHAVEIISSNAQTFEIGGQQVELTPEQLAEAARKLQSAADKAKKEPQKPKLKVGDWVRNIDDDDIDLTIGRLYKVVEIDGEGDAVIIDDRGHSTYIAPSDFEIIAEPTPFDRAGRKPGEFKKGDIVRVTDPCASRYVDKGDIVEVLAPYNLQVAGRSGYTPLVDVAGRSGYTPLVDAELVTPVESRVDIEGVENA